MSRDITVDSLFFGVEQVPVEAVANLNGKERRIVVPGKKALINAASATVLMDPEGNGPGHLDHNL